VKANLFSDIVVSSTALFDTLHNASTAVIRQTDFLKEVHESSPVLVAMSPRIMPRVGKGNSETEGIWCHVHTF
jgi:hypothetical protein